MTPTEELIAAILAATDDVQLQRALLVGSYGESGWNPGDVGSGGGGAFGFTPPSYPAWLWTAAPAVQVATILPAYQSAQVQLPSSITNPAAQAQWIAIAAERPEFDTAEMSTIQATNAPTTYGANSSYTVQNWAEIVALTPEPVPPSGGLTMFVRYSGKTAKYENGLIAQCSAGVATNMGGNWPNIVAAYTAAKAPLVIIEDPNGTLLDSYPVHHGF